MSHAPKTAALIAFAEGLLSDAGQARVEKHLAGCEICRRELASIRAYDRVAEEARQATPELDFSRMEQALGREAERLSIEIRIAKRPPYGWYAMAAAAAVLMVLWAAWPNAPATEVAESPTEELPVAPEPALLTPTVTLAAGNVIKVDTPPVQLEPGAVLHEGDVIRSAEGSELHVLLASGTGFVAGASTELAIERAREDAVQMALTSGRISNTVAPLHGGSTYTILAAGHSIEVRGTRFVVSYVDLVVGVDLTEGSVLVRTPNGREIELVAPARWRSDAGISGDTAPEAAVTPRGQVGTPVLLAQPEAVRWEIDGTTVAAIGALRLQVAPGEHRVRAWDREDRAFTAMLQVGAAPAYLSEGQLEPEAPRLRQGHLDEENVERVMQAGMQQLARCHERAMRLRPDVRPPRMRLRVHVGLLGEVHRAQLLDAETAAPELRECILNYARSWTFDPPGGAVPPIEQPLVFSSRQ